MPDKILEIAEGLLAELGPEAKAAAVEIRDLLSSAWKFHNQAIVEMNPDRKLILQGNVQSYALRALDRLADLEEATEKAGIAAARKALHWLVTFLIGLIAREVRGG